MVQPFGENIGIPDRLLTPNLSSTPSKPRPAILRLDELIEASYPESDSYLSGDLLTKGDVCLVAGRRKVGKTYLVLYLCACVAGGLPFGQITTKPGRILYLSQEMSEKALHKRLKRLFPNQDDYRRICHNLFFLCKYRYTLDTTEGAAMLREVLKEAADAGEPFDGIVIDALRDVKGSAKESSNDDMGAVMVRLRDDVILPANVFCILVHHMGKPNPEGQTSGGRGASTIEDVVAEAIYLERCRNSKTKRRGEYAFTREGELEGETFIYQILEDPETKTISVELSADEETSTDDDLDVRKLSEWVKEQPGFVTAKEIMERFMFKRSNGFEKIRRAVTMGLIAKRGNKYINPEDPVVK